MVFLIFIIFFFLRGDLLAQWWLYLKVKKNNTLISEHHLFADLSQNPVFFLFCFAKSLKSEIETHHRFQLKTSQCPHHLIFIFFWFCRWNMHVFKCVTINFWFICDAIDWILNDNHLFQIYYMSIKKRLKKKLKTAGMQIVRISGKKVAVAGDKVIFWHR